MANIIDNLLELSRWQSHRLELQSNPVDIGSELRKVVDCSSKKSDKHRLIADISTGLPAVNADPTRIERVLDNLIDNAIKYSPDGGEVTVSVRQKGDCILIGVRDQGIGIAPGDAERLFKPFSRLETAVSGSAIQGIGLGLVVCKHLVEAHGGNIWVESNRGKGSSFYFTLPVN
jgi:signal transduction histidine kinase